MSGMGKFFYGILVSVGLAALSAPLAGAFSSDPRTFVSGDNTFYAYVETGEKVNIGFAKSEHREPSGMAPKPITVTVNAPGAQPQTCVIPVNVPIGQGCNMALTAVKNGIWRINFQLPQDAHVHPEVSSNVRWNGNLFSWNVTVSEGGIEKKGRLWSELYAIRQPAPPRFLADFTFHYMSEDGYLYKVVYRGYNGQISTLTADAFGVVQNGECVTAYQSIATSNTTMKPSFGSCGGSYKLFFEQPSDELPTEAAKWDDTKDWIRPNIDRPVVEGLKFTPDQATTQQSGTISYTLKNFVGQYEVRIDTNGDGNYDGPRDITLKKQIKNLKSAGEQKISFDGLDRDDNTIPRTQAITVKINIVKSGEIHLVGADIEGREGGIELVRLSGDNVPSFDVCWNDTELGANSDGVGSVLTLDGKSCPDSTGGVHKWRYSETGNSWGNARYIDDWVYTSARVSGKSEMRYPEKDAVVIEDIVQRNMGLGVIIGCIVVVLGVGTGVALWLRKRRRQHDDDNLMPPSQFPPSGPPAAGPPQPPFNQ